MKHSGLNAIRPIQESPKCAKIKFKKRIYIKCVVVSLELFRPLAAFLGNSPLQV